MRKLSESVWGDIRKKSLGKVDRQENAFNPDFIDFGDNTTVYWTKKTIDIKGNNRFLFDEVKDYNNNGWRLPTFDEVSQIDWKEYEIYTYKGDTYIKLQNGEFVIESAGLGNINMWMKEEKSNFMQNSYGYNNLQGTHEFSTKRFNKNYSTLYALLVKDKDKRHLSESVWGDLRKKSLGQEERIEDSINDMNLGQFCDYLKDTYKCIDRQSDISIDVFEHVLTICICLYKDETGYYRYIYYDGTGIDVQDDVPSTIGCLPEMEERYSIKPRVRQSINIFPKDNSKVTNKFFIEVLDFLLDRIDTPLEQQVVKK